MLTAQGLEHVVEDVPPEPAPNLVALTEGFDIVQDSDDSIEITPKRAAAKRRAAPTGARKVRAKGDSPCFCVI